MIPVLPADSKSAGNQIAPPPPVYDVAISYPNRGFAVVPQLPGEKHPCVQWKPFQQRLPTAEEWRAWSRRWPNAGVAAVLGPVSNLLAVGIGGPEAHAALLRKSGAKPAAPKVQSGSGKPHRYHLCFRYPAGLTTPAKYTPWHPKLESRGHRGVIILPPSLHRSGNAYRFGDGRSFGEVQLSQPPAAVLEELAARAVDPAAADGSGGVS